MKPEEQKRLVKKTLTEVGRYLASGFSYLGIKEQIHSTEVVEYKGSTYDVEVIIKKRK